MGILSFFAAHSIALIGTLGLGGIAAAGFASPPFGAVLLGCGKTIGEWLSRRSLAEIVAIVIAVALVVDHIALLASHRHAQKLETQLSKATVALDASRANETTLLGGIKTLNDAANNLAAKTIEEQKAVQAAAQKAAPRAAEAKNVADKLAESAKHSPAPGAACEPSEALKEQWQ
jgi:hypothetical protein